MTHAAHDPDRWTCPICQEGYRPGQVVQRVCCALAAWRAVPVLDVAPITVFDRRDIRVGWDGTVHDAEWPPAWTQERN